MATLRNARRTVLAFLVAALVLMFVPVALAGQNGGQPPKKTAPVTINGHAADKGMYY